METSSSNIKTIIAENSDFSGIIRGFRDWRVVLVQERGRVLNHQATSLLPTRSILSWSPRASALLSITCLSEPARRPNAGLAAARRGSTGGSALCSSAFRVCLGREAVKYYSSLKHWDFALVKY